MIKQNNFNNFVGIDVSKDTLDISVSGSNFSIANNKKSISKFIKSLDIDLDKTMVIIDLTGGYEHLAVETFYEAGFNIHRAEGRKVKSFIKALGTKAKTDKIDAKMLALYGEKLQENLALFTPKEKDLQKIKSLSSRLTDLKEMLQKEKNRFKAPNNQIIKKSCSKLIKLFEKEIISLDEEINSLIKANELLTQKKKIMMEQKGIGGIVSNTLIASLPELGQVNRRQITAISGLAPYANDSGKYSGYRKTRGGRKEIKKALFIAALSAIKNDKKLKEFYHRLVANGKKKMVALTAVMRKIIIILNAKIKQNCYCG